MYSLLLVNKKSRYKVVHPLQNLASDQLPRLKLFLIDVDGCFKAICAESDNKLLGGNVKAFLLDNGIDILTPFSPSILVSRVPQYLLI